MALGVTANAAKPAHVGLARGSVSPTPAIASSEAAMVPGGEAAFNGGGSGVLSETSALAASVCTAASAAGLLPWAAGPVIAVDAIFMLGRQTAGAPGHSKKAMFWTRWLPKLAWLPLRSNQRCMSWVRIA